MQPNLENTSIPIDARDHLQDIVYLIMEPVLRGRVKISDLGTPSDMVEMTTKFLEQLVKKGAIEPLAYDDLEHLADKLLSPMLAAIVALVQKRERDAGTNDIMAATPQTNPVPKIEDIITDYPEFSGVHPIANAFPMKPEGEFGELVEHIREHGVASELIREKGTNLLVDGRARLLAVSITHSLFEVVDVDPEHVFAYVTATNFHAKKFDASQRGVVNARLMPFHK